MSTKIDKVNEMASTVQRMITRQEQYGEGVDAIQEQAQKAAKELVESYWSTGFSCHIPREEMKYGLYVITIYDMKQDDERELRWFLDDMLEQEYDLTVAPLGGSNQVAVFWYVDKKDRDSV